MSQLPKSSAASNNHVVERYVDPFDLLFSRSSIFDDSWPFSLLPRRILDETSVAPHGQSANMKKFYPLLSADLTESDTDFHIHVDLPGVDKQDLDISFHDGLMTIEAERKQVLESNSVFHTVHKVERNFGKVKRSIAIPKNADAEHAQASLKDGVLMITFPKLQHAAKRQKIPIA